MGPLELRLAWRNVWRNPRRTALTVAAGVFAVYLTVFFVGMAAGVHEKMIEDAVRIGSGHVSISGEGYLENRTLDHYLVLDPALGALLDAAPAVTGWSPRVVSFALLSEATTAQGAIVLGVDPEREPRVSTLPERVGEGRFLSTNGNGANGDGNAGREIVLGARLADLLGAEVGDELLMYGAAYSLETAYELFRLVGLIDLPDRRIERRLALVSLRDAQDFFVYGERVSEIAVLAESDDDTRDLLGRLSRELAEIGPGSEVHAWYEITPELEQILFLDDAGMFLMLAILVVVVGFGILNTILMSVLERTRELGVMMAVGLRPGAVFRVVYLESIFLASVGLVIGLVFAIPSVLWLEANPIPLTGSLEGATELIGMEPVLTAKLKPLNPIGSTLTILIVALLAALYPALKASRSRPVDALRSL